MYPTCHNRRRSNPVWVNCRVTFAGCEPGPEIFKPKTVGPWWNTSGDIRVWGAQPSLWEDWLRRWVILIHPTQSLDVTVDFSFRIPGSGTDPDIPSYGIFKRPCWRRKLSLNWTVKRCHLAQTWLWTGQDGGKTAKSTKLPPVLSRLYLKNEFMKSPKTCSGQCTVVASGREMWKGV